MSKDIYTADKEPPGSTPLPSVESTVTQYQIVKRQLPQRKNERYDALRSYALFIHNAYTEYPVGSLDELPQHKTDIAVAGLIEADSLIEAWEGDQLVGLLAYTDHTRENNPKAFTALSETNVQVRRDRIDLKVRFDQADKQIRHIVHIAELAVRKDKRGNGVSSEMRSAMAEDLAGQLVLEIGEIQSISPLLQRLKLPGSTYFAGELLKAQEGLHEDLGFTLEEFALYAQTKGRMYANQFPNSKYDVKGIMTSDLFEFPSKRPERVRLEGEQHILVHQALGAILDRQVATGEKCSAVAVTIYRP